MATQAVKAIRMLERSAHDAQVALERIKETMPDGELQTAAEGVYDAFRNAAQKFGEATRSQANVLANTAYATGGRAAKRVQREVVENWIDLALGGLVGLAIGYLVGRRV